MKTTCEQFANAVVTDDDTTSFTAHVTTCKRCQGLARTVAGLGATIGPRSDRALVHSKCGPGQSRAANTEPSVGFSARMAVGAQHRVAQRRRNRYVMASAGGLAAAVAVTALLISQRHAGTPLQPTTNVPVVEQPDRLQPDPVVDLAPAPVVADEDRENLRALVRWQATADTWQQARLPSALNWRATIKPVTAYQTVLTLQK